METFRQQDTLALASQEAARMVVHGDADWLVVLGPDVPHIPGEQGDDDVRAVAAIDVLRYLVETYESEEA